MAYIGREPQVGNFQVCDDITVVNGQAAYTMQVGGVNVLPETANHCLVSLNGVLQKSSGTSPSFTISGSTITFASNLVTGDVINFIHILGSVLDLGVPSDSTVSLAKLTATGTKSSSTFLRGDNTFAEAGGGKLLQSSLTTASTEQTVATATFTDLTGLTVNITPVSQTSKFLITAYMNVALPTTSGGASDIGWNSKILRDSTTVVSNAVTSSYGSIYYLQGSSNLHLFDTIIGLDDHNTTSQVTIKVQGREPEGNTAVLSKGSAANSYLLVQEIET
jgi:hypothetical protein